MSYLEQFKKENARVTTEHIGGRVPSHLVKAFKQHVSAQNLTLSDGLRLLIERELREAAAAGSTSAAASVETPKKPMPSEPKQVKRGEIDLIYIDGNGAKLKPCPVCDTWQSASNYARHFRKHGYKHLGEMLDAPGNREKVLQMLAEKKEAGA